MLIPPASSPLPGDADLDEHEVRAAGRDAVDRALAEDLGEAGDLTVAATVPPRLEGDAALVAREEGVVAGLWLVAEVYGRLDPAVTASPSVSEGAAVAEGTVLARLRGPVGALLTGERTALNLVGHLSGVATATARVVAEVAGTGVAVRDTRKTTPGLRLLEKAAVRAGGGANHRIGLHDALLVKDNHVALAGGVAEATRRALAGAHGRHVQVEVDSLAELEAAVGAGARDVLLDNFDVASTRRAVAWVRAAQERLGERVLLESSGTLRLGRVRPYAEAGVDRLALGSITHSAAHLDVALDVVHGPEA